LSKLNDQQDKLEKDVEGLKSEIETLKVNISEAKVLIKEADTKLETAIEAKLVEGLEDKLTDTVTSKMETQAKSIREDIAEKLEIEKRRNNLVFHGVEESVKDNASNDSVNDSDAQKIETILKSGLNLDSSRHVSLVTRIGRYSTDKVRPIRVVTNSIESKSEILKRAKNLKDCNGYEKVYISPDLTRKQQIVDKDLRVHMKQFRDEGHNNVRIKGGKVIKNERGGQETLLYQPPSKAVVGKPGEEN
jgi:hypothetical protein